MGALIALIFYLILFAILAYSLWWVCTHFGLPAPVLWLCGAILLLIILVFAANQLGVTAGWPQIRPH